MEHMHLDDLIRRALAEDMGVRGDITTALTIPRGAQTRAVMRARGAGVAAGVAVAVRVFAVCGAGARARVADGAALAPGDVLLEVAGDAHAVLAAERVALNLAARLSGVATATRALVDAVAGTGAAVAHTRKTTPGLRALEIAAVRAGGGAAHRAGLGDAVLIKDNHIALAGGVGPALAAARAGAGHMTKIAIEVDTLEQLSEALDAGGAEVVLLDNMSVEDTKRAVSMVSGRAVLEYSGSVRPETARPFALAGVDVLSSGWITHSAPALDIGLDIST
jgi:nicotinate-nucleotide pyrophosphorylase (carboxylating)